MKTIKTALLCISVGFQLIAFSQNRTVYSSPAFTIFDNRVVQGNYTSTALSATEMQSDYQSQETAFKNPRISFKFSINGLDNEMAPGINHEFVCLSPEKTVVTPPIKFGKRFVDTTPVPAETYLKPNTLLLIRLDMREVFDQFNKLGYYTNFNGTKLYKADFKGVFVAGSILPMVWNFDNLSYHQELQLTDPDDDGIYELILKVNPKEEKTSLLRTWKLSKNISAFPQLKTPFALENAIYNMSVEEMEKAIEKDSTLRTGIDWPGVWTRDVSYSIILSMAHMQPKVAQNSLMRKVNANGRIIQDTGTGGAWPASTDRMIWVTAAWEIYKVTGDQNWLKKVYPIIKKSIEDDLKVAFDPTTGQMKGESSFLDWREQTYPRWMQPADIYSSKNLGTNALHYNALKVLAQMASCMKDQATAIKMTQQAGIVKNAINQLLWLPEQKYYGQYRYGRNYELLSPRSEALGEALCVVFDVADAQRQREIVQHTPVVEYGIPCIYPQIGDIPPYHNNAVWPFVQTYWLWAGAKTGNEKSVLHSIAAIYRAAALFLTNKENFVAENGDYAGTQINSSNMLWSLSGNISLVHKVLFGIRFDENSLRFEPFVPEQMAGSRTLNQFKYRNALLNIEMEGFGNRIASFMVDGKVQASAAVPASLKGTHQIRIQLSNQKLPEQPIHLVKNQSTPLMPLIALDKNTISWGKVESADRYLVLKNGKEFRQVQGNSIDLAGEQGEFQVMAIDKSGQPSFASEPVTFIPGDKVIKVECESQVQASPLSYQGFSGKGFVEISRTINRDILLNVSIEKEGNYAIDWCYANGNGPTNTENKCALRTLFIDQKPAGTCIFPQRGSQEWSNWGFSNVVSVHLTAGKHQLRLQFLPENENMNINTNQAMLDYVRIMPR